MAVCRENAAAAAAGNTRTAWSTVKVQRAWSGRLKDGAQSRNHEGCHTPNHAWNDDIHVTAVILLAVADQLHARRSIDHRS